MTETTGAAQGTERPLDWITVEGFRSIACVEQLELRPVNVPIGANGAGKSNLVNAFSLLRAWAKGACAAADRAGGRRPSGGGDGAGRRRHAVETALEAIDKAGIAATLRTEEYAARWLAAGKSEEVAMEAAAR